MNIRKQTAYAPTRIDLAGGTLDIWPLNMLVDRAVTVNVAIDLWATATIEDLSADEEAGKGARTYVRSEDQGIEEAWVRAASPPADTRLPLAAECISFFQPRRFLKLSTRCEAPAGAGLGGSSSLAISMLGGLQAFLSRPIMPPDEMVRVARDLEARVLRIPTGTQDHFAATYGGAAAIRYGPGPPIREALPLDLDHLGSRLVLAYSGASRLSATSNWDMVRRAIDGDRTTLAGLREISSIAAEMRAALIEANLDAAGILLGREWEERKHLSDKVSTPVIDKAIAVARASGAMAGKACGAGGGGCVAFLCKEGARESVVKALGGLASDGVSVLAARPTRIGLQLAS
jgi:D-glycero-alpha-D-manno-heptose-7-phosphate kinase